MREPAAKVHTGRIQQMCNTPMTDQCAALLHGIIMNIGQRSFTSRICVHGSLRDVKGRSGAAGKRFSSTSNENVVAGTAWPVLVTCQKVIPVELYRAVACGGGQMVYSVPEAPVAFPDCVLAWCALQAFKDSHRIARKCVGPFPPYIPSTGWNAIYASLHMCR